MVRQCLTYNTFSILIRMLKIEKSFWGLNQFKTNSVIGSVRNVIFMGIFAVFELRRICDLTSCWFENVSIITTSCMACSSNRLTIT